MQIKKTVAITINQFKPEAVDPILLTTIENYLNAENTSQRIYSVSHLEYREVKSDNPRIRRFYVLNAFTNRDKGRF